MTRKNSSMASDSIIYLCINLPWAEERRRSIQAQADRLGVDVQMVEAIAGKDLPPVVPEYDSVERAKTFAYDLTPNEIACVLSHKKAIRFFLDSGAEYAVIMEDDALIANNIKQSVHELTHSLRGWEVAKLYTDDGGTLYSLGDTEGKDSCVRAIFPKKLLWVAVGFLYTRVGAQKLLAELNTFSLAADVQIGHILLKKNIPTIGITPSLITTSDPNNENSTIGTVDCPRENVGHRSLLQYLRYRLSVVEISRAKKRMIRLMKKRLHRV